MDSAVAVLSLTGIDAGQAFSVDGCYVQNTGAGAGAGVLIQGDGNFGVCNNVLRHLGTGAALELYGARRAVVQGNSVRGELAVRLNGANAASACEDCTIIGNRIESRANANAPIIVLFSKRAHIMMNDLVLAAGGTAVFISIPTANNTDALGTLIGYNRFSGVATGTVTDANTGINANDTYFVPDPVTVAPTNYGGIRA
jgi:hypothetical protein